VDVKRLLFNHEPKMEPAENFFRMVARANVAGR